MIMNSSSFWFLKFVEILMVRQAHFGVVAFVLYMYM